VQPVEARAELLTALEAVDLVVVFDEDTPEKLIRHVKPTVLVKGGDYKRDKVVGRSPRSLVCCASTGPPRCSRSPARRRRTPGARCRCMSPGLCRASTASVWRRARRRKP
jgi:hypothetical protein